MTEKPIAAEMLKLHETDPDAFWLEVSRAISPKPWPHHCMAVDSGPIPPVECARCDAQWDSGLMRRRDHSQCPVPPELTDPPEVVAATLLQDVKQRNSVKSNEAAIGVAMESLFGIRPNHRFRFWLILSASERVACCLIALDKWRS